MASTRTLVPVPVFHESTAPAERSHAKRTLYAGLRWAWRAAAAGSLGGLAVAPAGGGQARRAAGAGSVGALAVAPAEGRQAPPSHTPCAQCVRFTVSAGEALAL